MSPAEPHPLAADVLALLDGRGETLATAESLTGGMLGALLTSVPGASAVYLGGVVTYAVELKLGLLGVPADVLAEHGVVSRACAEAMAAGVRTLVGADVALATTGVAGPGPQDGVPAGTVWVALATSSEVIARQVDAVGDRHDVRRVACDAALGLLLPNSPPTA